MLDLYADPVLESECVEPEGTKVRRVYLFPCTLNNLGLFYEKARKFPTLFGRCIDKSPAQFREIFFDSAGGVKGLFYVIDDLVGMYYLTDITPYSAVVHYTFLDRRSKGRLELTKNMIDYVFREFGLNRLTVELPTYASRDAEKFVRNLGFTFEGKEYMAVRFRDKWHHISRYGMLNPYNPENVAFLEEKKSWDQRRNK